MFSELRRKHDKKRENLLEVRKMYINLQLGFVHK